MTDQQKNKVGIRVGIIIALICLVGVNIGYKTLETEFTHILEKAKDTSSLAICIDICVCAIIFGGVCVDHIIEKAKEAYSFVTQGERKPARRVQRKGIFWDSGAADTIRLFVVAVLSLLLVQYFSSSDPVTTSPSSQQENSTQQDHH